MATGQVKNFEKRVEIPWGETVDVHVTCQIDLNAEGEPDAIPPESYAYIYQDNDQITGTYFRQDDTTGIATITLDNRNTTGELEEFDEQVYSFWNGDIADDAETITISYLPPPDDYAALDPQDDPAYLKDPRNPRSRERRRV